MKLARLGALISCLGLFAAGTSCASKDDSECEPWAEGLTSCDVEGVSCEERAEVTSMWLESIRECDDSSDCRLLTSGECIGAFLCGTPVSTKVDLDEVDDAARRLSEQHMQAGCGCAIADCGLGHAECRNHTCIIASDQDGAP